MDARNVARAMDKFNIAAALLSLTMQREQFYDGTEKGRDLIRTCNEFGAKCMQKNPKRLGLLAGLPFPISMDSLQEIEYAYETLKADGIGIYSSTGDRWPGDPMFEPIMAELNRRSAPVLIHAAVPNCCNHTFPPGISPGNWTSMRRAVPRVFWRTERSRSSRTSSSSFSMPEA